ncbi:MAG TPA: glycosyltransferase [Dongiaceae bacterium]|nr:glycosyltransferase [Dongiaceae bacterium]
MKKAVVIAHALTAGGGASVGKNFIREFVRAAAGYHFLMIIPEGQGYEVLLQAHPNCELFVYRTQHGKLARLWFDEWGLPRVIRRFDPDLVVGLGNKGIIGFGGVQAILVHNAYLFYPWPFAKSVFLLAQMERIYLMWHLKKVLRDGADLLLVQTQTAAQRMRASYAFSGKVALLPNAISQDTHQAQAGTQYPTAMKGYEDKLRLFCLTRYYPHKNLEILLELFKQDRGGLDGVVIFITIDSGQHPMASRLLQDISHSGLSSRIVNIGPVPQSDLAGYYHHAHALILPTLLESFSGTYIEAMQFGIPILTSDRDFAQEVCGDLAIYFQPDSVESIRQAIDRLGSIEKSQDFTERCRERLADLGSDWTQNVNQLVSMLDGMLSPKRR